MGVFSVEDGAFRLDGAEFRVLSGAMHYFRTHPAQWRHRLAMLRAMGLNTVETYVPWNLHEPRQGEFRRMSELGDFLDAAAEAGLLAIVRPGPYICAEWDNGGLPAWLTGRIRTSDPEYLGHVDRFFDRILPQVAERQVTRGGNVIMVQVENEYGSYGSDHAYLRHLADGLRARGVEVPLFTSDGPADWYLTGGTVPGVLATVNFGSDPDRAFATLREHRPDDPLFCMEFWCGWFDHWGQQHMTRDAGDAAAVLERILELGASVNLYMAHGGTNFGTWAGANQTGERAMGDWRPTVTSYDYDAPIDERGAPTEKFWRFREVLSRFAGEPPEVPPVPDVLPAATLRPVQSVSLREALEAVAGPEVSAPVPPSFEELGLEHGLVLYRGEVPGPRGAYRLRLPGLRDRAHVLVDGVLAGVFERDAEEPEVTVSGPATVEVLVESMGRTNYGPLTGESKGLTGGVLHHQQYLNGWSARPIPLEDVSAVPFADEVSDGPRSFFRFELEVAEPADTFLALPGWGKGYVWVNGFCLGRYWAEGPQHTLYVPAPLLRSGTNDIIVLELDQPAQTLHLTPTPTLS
ncbi:beta-galactosidase family protein [Nonomuraea spiralis]|uniref:Beta-galactosidase family protein n=1 Tax=Nonomuraea spiralis TaxID=46182 RepID=A0ABV5IJC8_9ACTN|nr:beta-galactosidase family protein [Nonomuraea spiralis]GGT41724.1 beta-galactosidase [Nonomuraea spiralis]